MLTADRVLGGLVLLKAVDVALRGPTELSLPLWAALLALWVASAAALVAGGPGSPRPAATAARTTRAAWAGVLVAGAGFAVDLPLELRRQHLVLLMGVALVGVVAREDAERLLLWRVQLSALYGVAALAKLNESFLGGGVLAAATAGGPLGLPPLPLAVLLAAGVGLVAAEALLAVTPWIARLRRLGVAVAVALHGVALLVVGGGPLVTLRLVVFGGTAVLLHAASAGLLPVRRSATPRPARR